MNLIINNKVVYAKETLSGEYAWEIKDAVDVLEYMSSKGCIVLGGDILNKELRYTYDNWYYNTDKSKSLQKNSVDSIRVAIEYISRYIKKNGKDCYVVIVVKKHFEGGCVKD